jgi:hypothetical protein
MVFDALYVMVCCVIYILILCNSYCERIDYPMRTEHDSISHAGGSIYEHKGRRPIKRLRGIPARLRGKGLWHHQLLKIYSLL